MNYELWINIATIASPVIGAIAIIVALGISHLSSRDTQKQIDEIRKSTTQQINALKDIIAHQGDIEWGHLQHYYMMNLFEQTDEQNRLNFLQKKIHEFEKAGTHSKLEMDELRMQEQLLLTRIKNREITNGNYKKLLQKLDISTTSVLFEKTNPKQ
jgi:hypothetical protein